MTVVTLHGTPLVLHLAAAVSPVPSAAIVVYASGDGGWFGAAIDMFRTIAALGHPTVGFSSRAFLKIERPAHAALSAGQLAADYATILTHARRVLGVAPDTPAILSGWSRGAAFAAIVGSEPLLRDQVRGIIAIGLGADEDFQIGGSDDQTDDAPPTGRAPRASALSPYDRLRTTHGVRYAVIQATGDRYLPAAHAHDLFGDDTMDKRFYVVQARNHRFSGGHPALVAALASAVTWVAGSPPPSQ